MNHPVDVLSHSSYVLVTLTAFSTVWQMMNRSSSKAGPLSAAVSGSISAVAGGSAGVGALGSGLRRFGCRRWFPGRVVSSMIGVAVCAVGEASGDHPHAECIEITKTASAKSFTILFIFLFYVSGWFTDSDGQSQQDNAC